MSAMMETSSSVLTIEADTELPPGKIAISFGASWDDASALLAQLFAELARTGAHPSLTLGVADAEQCDALVEKFGVEAVPTVVLIERGAASGTLEAPDAAAVAAALESFAAGGGGSGGAAAAAEAAAVAAAQLEQRIKQLVNASRCVLFMKGSPTTPRCGFSRQVVELLDAGAVPYSTFDILTDDAVRQGLKKFSDWPTYPQLYANGELIGGLDILKEMAADGDLLGQLDLQAEEVIEKAVDPLTARLTALVKHAPVMLFMKGKPGAEQCGFSRTICALLAEHQIAFDSFDILTDDAVRQGLKKFSDWPTFPQLYVNGDLAGGLDILTEMAADGDLKTQLLG